MSNETTIQKPSRAASRIKAVNLATGAKLENPLYVSLPKDMYAHKIAYFPHLGWKGASTEWWWHIGTLTTADGERTFGFEINACALYPGGLTEVMLTDVKNQKHYNQTTITKLISPWWAESDQTKPWSVNLNSVHMKSPDPANPAQNMNIKARLVDGTTIVDFDLNLSQNGAPLYVFGTGATPPVSPNKLPTLNDNNFYFSLTRLNATGTIKISKTNSTESPEVIEVVGTTWMDHEWGNFTDKNSSTGKPQSVQWILQDMQLDNGICLSNFTLKPPTLNIPMKSKATVQLQPNGESHYVETTMTATKQVKYQVETYNKKTKKMELKDRTYFTEIVVSVPEFGIEATVIASMDKQLFEFGIYEGVGTVNALITPQDGSSEPQLVNGAAWVEQNIF